MTLPALPGCLTLEFIPTSPSRAAESRSGEEVVRFASTDGLTLEGRLFPPRLVQMEAERRSGLRTTIDGQENVPLDLDPRAVRRRPWASDAEIEQAIARIRSTVAEGDRASRFADPTYERAAVLFCHGATDSNASPMANAFAQAGLRVFSFDYRGFGNSDAAPLTNRGLADDALAALTYLRSRPDVDPDRILIYGHSMGAGYAMAAAAMAAQAGHPVAGVIAAGGFTNWREVTNDNVPVLGLLLGGVMGPEPIDWARRLRTTPLLVIHANDDRVVSPRFARQLFEAATGAGVPATLSLHSEGDHVTGYLAGPESPIGAAMVRFALDRLAKPRATESQSQPPAKPAHAPSPSE